MSSIRISQLPVTDPAGAELFQDSESFLQELQDHEIKTVIGGLVVTQVTVSVGYRNVPGRLVIAYGARDSQALQLLRTRFRKWFNFLERYSAYLPGWLSDP